MPHNSFDLVRFGLGSGEEPDEKQFAFYKEVARLVSGRTLSYEASALPFHTVETARVLGEEWSIYQPLYEALEAIPERVGLGILDLSVSTRMVNTELFLRPKAITHIASAITASFASGKWNNRVLVVLLPGTQAGTDGLRHPLSAHLASEQIIILGDDGSSSAPQVNKDDYGAALARVRNAPIDLLRRKLIIRLGWFHPHGSHSGRQVLRHYFDAQRAQNELGQLLDEAIGVDDRARRPDLVVYHESVANWLANPLRGSCIRADSLPVHSYAEVTDPLATVDHYQGQSVLLVVPVVHTGTSLLEKVSALEARLNPRPLRILSVLCADGEQERFGRRRIEDGYGQERDIDYFLSVSQLTEPAKDCRLAIFGETKRHEELSSFLTTGEFWELVRLCGTKEEEAVPAHRAGYRAVPDIPQMLEQYGSWLADKLWMSVRARTKTVGQDILLVSPDGEVGSSKLSHYVSLLSGARVVRIPRPAIKKVINGTRPDELFDESAPWSQELDSVALKEVVLIDEFIGDGKTMWALERIARAKNLSVLAVCALLDLSPSTSGDRHSLYAWQPQITARVPMQRIEEEDFASAGLA
ncbi:hypothetical protein [Micromonospora sp. NPDC005087]|uniref:hypothetical protein n=1 Tax=Micromonospora sp. NPDC005087 TaxID=3364225 RepID=UPI0036921DDB